MNVRGKKGANVPVTRSDGFTSLFDLWVLRQARARAIPVDLLSDLLEITKEHRRVLDVAMLGIADIAGHAPLSIEVLALQRGLQFALHEVNAGLVMTLPAEARRFGADLGADVVV
jgi:hypothetical protein